MEDGEVGGKRRIQSLKTGKRSDRGGGGECVKRIKVMKMKSKAVRRSGEIVGVK